MFRDPQVPASYVEVETLRKWLGMLLDPTASDDRDKLIAGLRQRIQGALATHNPPTGELVVDSGHFLQVLTECTCSMVSAGVYSHEPDCRLDMFGPVEDFVRPLRKAGYVVIEPGSVEEILEPEPPVDVDACSCDTNPATTDGPSIDCPQHGESVQQRLDREAAHMRSIGYAMRHFTSESIRIPARDEVGDRQARLREAAQQLNRVGHDLRSEPMLRASRDLTAELGAGWGEIPTVSALSGSLPSPGSQDTGEPPLGATLDEEDVEPR